MSFPSWRFDVPPSALIALPCAELVQSTNLETSETVWHSSSVAAFPATKTARYQCSKLITLIFSHQTRYFASKTKSGIPYARGYNRGNLEFIVVHRICWIRQKSPEMFEETQTSRQKLLTSWRWIAPDQTKDPKVHEIQKTTAEQTRVKILEITTVSFQPCLHLLAKSWYPQFVGWKPLG